MKRPSIKLTLIGIVTGLFLATAVIGTVGYVGMNNMQDKSNEISDNALPSVAASKDVSIALGELRLAYIKHILMKDPASLAAQEQAINERRANFDKALDVFTPLGTTEGEKANVALIREDIELYTRLGKEMIALSNAMKNDEAANFITEKLAPVGNKMSGEINELVRINLDAAKAAALDADEVTVQSQTILLTVALIALLLAFGAIVLIVTGVANPIVRINQSMRKLADGNTDDTIPFADRTDEIGAMAGSVEVFRQAAIANKRLEREAEEARQRAESDRIAAQEKAEADAAERLRIATSGLAVGLKRMAEGDLAFQLTEAFAPDFESLRHDFNASINQLGTAMSSISEGVGTIDDSTREIASGAGDLSKRTEQQAASLEETAAALDQITVNVSNSTKRTEEARSVATQANHSAAKSAEVVSQAEDAMRRIEASSQQISNIIGVIDEIAFQTNLLALNAGVEAARAGDAGKGFAVVAQEVRELAQRSANAAKEIKGLIQNSSTEVQGGVKLVRDAGEALNTIVGFITQINSHMDSIATSAREQSTGLAEINTAVNQMDQSTQQNAAMVEQSTAASASLAQEAARLRDLVSQFKVEGGANAASHLRQAARSMATPRAVESGRQGQAVRRVANGPAAAVAEWKEF